MLLWSPIEWKIYLYTLGLSRPGLLPQRVMNWLDNEIVKFNKQH